MKKEKEEYVLKLKQKYFWRRRYVMIADLRLVQIRKPRKTQRSYSALEHTVDFTVLF